MRNILELARISPEIRAAAETMIHLAQERDQTDFRERVFRFFVEYDQVRSLQFESLKAQLIEALKWSAKPLTLDSPPIATSGTFEDTARLRNALAQMDGWPYDATMLTLTSRHCKCGAAIGSVNILKPDGTRVTLTACSLVLTGNAEGGREAHTQNGNLPVTITPL